MTTQRCDRFCTKHHSTQSKRITCNSSESAPIKIRVYNCLFILDCEIPSLEGHYYYNAPCCQCVIFLSTHTCPKLTYWISETITYMDFETQFRWSVFTLIFRNLNWIITPKNSTKTQKKTITWILRVVTVMRQVSIFPRPVVYLDIIFLQQWKMLNHRLEFNMSE